MFLKDVIMDGFKCYSQKTILKNLDRSFTAITGMNGSGKSNIIDAIIFTLDLNTSKYMRVSTLKELININRKECTVTLVFDNLERRVPGYEEYDVVEVSRSMDSEGKSKYKLNGHSCTKGSIDSLCKAMGVSNDFVVMQGHITKIVNMKNNDLKNMIEEVAGTRMYTQEREKSLELLNKKEFKLREAREHLKRTISPFFEELKQEKRLYEDNKEFEANKKAFKEELTVLEERSKMEDLRMNLEELRNLTREYLEEKEALERLEEGLTVKNRNTNEINKEINEEKARLEELREKDPSEQIEERLKELEKYQNVIRTVEKYNLEDLKGRESILVEEVLKGGSDKLQELERLRASLINKEISLKSSAFSSIKKDREIVDFDEIKKNCENLKSKINFLRNKIYYPTPGRIPGNFLPGVYGSVDENFDLLDEKYKEAIFTILGGRNKFVICEDDEISLKLIQSSDRKISCIPINKIMVKTTHKIKGIIAAIDTIRFDRRLEKVFEHLLGGFYIFENKEQASDCCYKNKVMCVTLDGTVYDPKGTLTGGKTVFKNEVFRMTDLIEAERRLEEEERRMPNEEEIEEMNKAKERRLLEDEVEILKNKVKMMEQLCGTKIDAKKELERIRNEIVEAMKERETRRRAESERVKILKELEELKSVKNEIYEKITRTEKRLERLREEDRKVILEEGGRKSSMGIGESLEERRKNLIKLTVKKHSRIVKIMEEIRDEINFDKENKLNEQLKEEDHIEEWLKMNFNINLPPIKNNIKNINKIDINDRIEFLKSKLNQKRIYSKMDPKNFEILEKNCLAVHTLEEKIKKLEQDRNEILKSIEKLNEIGIKENKRAFEHINKTLKIFLGYFLKNSDILISEDFEIKVKVGNWKNSLSELSGGQKSLIALCLMFSMLTFKPAPFYIFDEIDAALDLNYTQKIGEIIKNEFGGAQFIIVSLKNNMFDNANRVFKVVIQEGKSKVIQIK